MFYVCRRKRVGLFQHPITSYHKASFSACCSCSHTCLHVVMCTYVLSVQSHVCVKAPIYLCLTCGPRSRQPLTVEAKLQAKCPASVSLSQMTLLTDLTVSASPSPGRPPPPPAITTMHSSFSWLTGLGYTTATVISHLLRCVYVSVVWCIWGVF